MATRKEQRRQAKQKERQKRIAKQTLAERVSDKLLDGLDEVDELMFRHDLLAAEETLDELAERWPNREEVLSRQVAVYRELNDENSLLQTAEQWRKCAPNDANVVAQWCWALAFASLPGTATLAMRWFAERWPGHAKTSGLHEIMQKCEEQAIENIRSFGMEPDDSGWRLLEAHEQVFQALRQTDFDRCLSLGESAIRELRPIPSILNNMAEAYFHLARLVDALNASRRAVELDPSNLFSKSNVIRFALLLGQRGEANAVANGMLDQKPERFDFWVRMIAALVLLERDDDALQLAKVARKNSTAKMWKCPESAELHHALGVALARKGRIRDAESNWQLATEVQPAYELAASNLEDSRQPIADQNGPVLYPLANFVSRRMIDDLATALEKLGRKASLEQQNVVVREFDAKCPGFVSVIPLLLRIGDDASRETAIRFAGFFNTPELREALREFALSDRGTDSRRMNALRELRRLGYPIPSPIRFFTNGTWRDIQDLEIEITDEPSGTLSDKVAPIMERGRAAMSQGDLKAAERAFREALKLEPDLVSAHNNVAAAVLAQDRFDEAERILKHVLTLDENNVIARANLARMALMNDDDDLALDWLRPLRVSRSFHTSEYAAMIGVDFELTIRKGEFTAAKQLLKSLEEIYPDYPHLPRFHEQLALAELADKFKALADLPDDGLLTKRMKKRRQT